MLISQRNKWNLIVLYFFLQHYYLYYGDGTEPIIVLSINKFVACMFAVGLAVGVVIAVGGLFFIQVRLPIPSVNFCSGFSFNFCQNTLKCIWIFASVFQVKTILRNETGIETWIIEKVNDSKSFLL